MKLDVPTQYSGKRQLGVRVWLTQMESYMHRMHYAPTDWLDVVAMRVEGRSKYLGECERTGCSGRSEPSLSYVRLQLHLQEHVGIHAGRSRGCHCHDLAFGGIPW